MARNKRFEADAFGFKEELRDDIFFSPLTGCHLGMLCPRFQNMKLFHSKTFSGQLKLKPFNKLLTSKQVKSSFQHYGGYSWPRTHFMIHLSLWFFCKALWQNQEVSRC